MEKVKVSKQVAETIKDLLKCGYTEYQITYNLCAGKYPHERFDDLHEQDVDNIIRALYIGYEVEQTPEDKVRELYEKYKSMAIEGNNIASGAIDGIEETLEAFNIKIPGVND